jgi:hypothetical protein
VKAEIDAGIADLFELTDAERDLISDFWAAREVGASKPLNADEPDSLERYLDVFAASWAPQLGDRAKLEPQVWQDKRARVIAAVFEIASPDRPESPRVSDDDRWSAVLDRYASSSRPASGRDDLVTYGILRAVSDSAVIVVKRNERRLWSRSAAREDAEATLAQAMALQRR